MKELYQLWKIMDGNVDEIDLHYITVSAVYMQ